MKQVILQIPEKKFSFFMELIKNLGFVKKAPEKDSSKEHLILELKEAIKELKMVEQGKLKARDAKDRLNKL